MVNGIPSFGVRVSMVSLFFGIWLGIALTILGAKLQATMLLLGMWAGFTVGLAWHLLVVVTNASN